MAVYRIYPEKDSYISSEPSIGGTYGNAGRDEILEVGGYYDINITGRANRSLIQFKTTEEMTHQKIHQVYLGSIKMQVLLNGLQLEEIF
mgnify:CR=1 FL=1